MFSVKKKQKTNEINKLPMFSLLNMEYYALTQKREIIRLREAMWPTSLDKFNTCCISFAPH